MYMYDLIISFGIPVSICVVLPVLIVWLVLRFRKHTIDKKVELLSKCIENGIEIDPGILANTRMKNGSTRKSLLNKLATAIIFLISGLAILVISIVNDMTMVYGPMTASIIILSVGLGMLAWYLTGVKFLKNEMEKEDKARENTEKEELQ